MPVSRHTCRGAAEQGAVHRRSLRFQVKESSLIVLNSLMKIAADSDCFVFALLLASLPKVRLRPSLLQATKRWTSRVLVRFLDAGLSR